MPNLRREFSQLALVLGASVRSFGGAVGIDDTLRSGIERRKMAFLIDTTPYTGGRSAGSLAWAGIWNTFYQIDLKRKICVIMMQFLPFVHKEAVGLLGDFERAAYGTA